MRWTFALATWVVASCGIAPLVGRFLRSLTVTAP
jgi:hypothetical protein